jgi:glycosyltransferase involved in cell wall biosynthesis
MIDNNNTFQLSVIMPVFNAEKYLKDSIKSILNQTYKNFEFIIINDGSTDKSIEIIKSFDDQRIKLINQKNAGIVSSLNIGLKVASGKFIARMDADDISLSERFEKQLQCMDSKNLDICGGNYMTISEKGHLIKSYSTPRSHEMCTLSLISKVPFAHPSVMIRRDFLIINNLQYGQSIYQKAEDLDLWVRIHERGGIFANVDDIILKYRIVKSSLSKKNNFKIINQTKALTQKFYFNNKEFIHNIILKREENLNSEEEAIIIRAIYKLYLKNGLFSKVYLLKNLNKKIILKTLLSEIKFSF